MQTTIIIILSILLVFMILCYAGQAIRLHRAKIEYIYVYKLFEHAQDIIIKHNLK